MIEDITECQRLGCWYDGDEPDIHHVPTCSLAPKVDYAALQKELSERDGCRECGECITVSYEFVNPEVLKREREGCILAGWKHTPYGVCLIHHCKDCREYNASTPYAWIADIASARFKAWCELHACAWTLDGMQPLLPESHPMYEQANGYNRDAIEEAIHRSKPKGGLEFL